MEHSEAGSKRSRKPYTLTKARESWSNDEHERFIKALQLYNRDWKKIETYVGTKTVVQIRSHAQKYFQKVMKSGITDAIPPPRPKRRASDGGARCHGGASCHTDAKHARLLSEHPTSRQGSGKDEDSDEGMLQHHSHAQHQTQHHHQQQHYSNKQHTAELMEPSAQLESSRALISSQGLQHVYLYLASLFSQPQADLAGMLQRLSTRDRHILAALLKSLVEELNHQQHAQPHALHSDQQQQHLHEDDQHHQHTADHQDQLLQQHQHVSGGSGGQSNGATVNTTAGTAPAADAADPAYAAALPASAAAAAAAVGDAGVAPEGQALPVKLEPGTVPAAAACVAAPSGQAVGGFSQQQLQQQVCLPASAGTATEHQPEHGSPGLQPVQQQLDASQQVQQQQQAPPQEALQQMQQQCASSVEAPAQQGAPISPAYQQQQHQLAQAQMQQEPWRQASSGQGIQAVHAADPGSSAATAGAAIAGTSPSQQLQQQESDAQQQQQQQVEQQQQQVEQQPEAMVQG